MTDLRQSKTKAVAVKMEQAEQVTPEPVTVKVTQLAKASPEEEQLRRLEQIVSKGIRTFIEVGEALAEIRDRKLYVVAGHTRFDTYLRERWGMSRSHAYRLIDSARVQEALSPTGDTDHAPKNEAVARELVPLLRKAPDQLEPMWRKLVEDHDGRPPASAVKGAVGRFIAHQEVMSRQAEPVPEPSDVSVPSPKCKHCWIHCPSGRYSESENDFDKLDSYFEEKGAP